ncbi:MAG: ATP-binding protein [Nocardioides sp.]
MPAKVIVLAGPSGAGKSRLCARFAQELKLPTINLDDFNKDGSDSTLPRVSIGRGPDLVDWDDPGSWLGDEAAAALERLCRDGFADVPDYEISRDGRVGHRTLDLGDCAFIVAEGIFAQEVAADCRLRGILAEAICVRHHPVVTFWRRLTRDLRERRKPPLVLLRRGVRLMRAEPRIVAHAVSLGCTAMLPDEAYHRVASLLGTTRARS